MVNIKSLEQYRKLKSEITQTAKRLEGLKDNAGAGVYAFDTVKGSSPVLPYHERIITITGISQRHLGTIRRLEATLENRVNRLQKSIVEIEEFIDTVERSEIRQIIQYRYIQGLSWNATGKRVYGYPCGDRVRMTITRFFAEK